MEKPLVSIMIPVYKRAALACQAIDCALRQEYRNIEVIVSDNHSGDGTYELLKEKYACDPRVILSENNTNIGAVGNWKVCLSRASGKYAMFLWSDDLLAEDFIRRSVSYLEAFPRAAFSYSSVVMFQDTPGLVDIRSEIQNKEPVNLRYRFGKTGEYSGQAFKKAQWIYHAYRVPVSPGCALFRREKIHINDEIPNDVGYIHSQNGAGIDLFIFLNSLENGESFVFIDKPMCYFREHASSISVFDKTIEIGYSTAEKYYLNHHDKKFLKWFYSDILVGKLRVSAGRLDREYELAKYYQCVEIPHSSLYYAPFVLYKILLHIRYRRMNRVIPFE